MDSTEEIYMKHRKMIYGLPLTRTQDPGLVEELTQRTLYQVAKRIGGYKRENSISTWLCTTARNLWHDYLRRQEDRVPLNEAERVSMEFTESRVLCSWGNVQILKLVHNLENPMREVVYLRLVGDLILEQIGEIVGCSENWARVTYYRGKERVVKETGKL